MKLTFILGGFYLTFSGSASDFHRDFSGSWSGPEEFREFVRICC
jgi:hypothetical protein